MKGRAFSLMELMVALVLAAIIGGVAVGAGMNINRALVDTRRRAVVWDEACDDPEMVYPVTAYEVEER